MIKVSKKSFFALKNNHKRFCHSRRPILKLTRTEADNDERPNYQYYKRCRLHDCRATRNLAQNRFRVSVVVTRLASLTSANSQSKHRNLSRSNCVFLSHHFHLHTRIFFYSFFARGFVSQLVSCV